MNVVVIGSNCFTGSHIVAALLENPTFRVHGISYSPEYPSVFLPYKALNSPNFQFYQFDLVSDFTAIQNLVSELKPSIIINVAALSEVELSNFRPVEYFDVNTVATVRLANFLREAAFDGHYIHISSAEVYGFCSSPVPETSPVNPSTPYAASKAAADLYLQSLRKNFGFPVTILRSTNVYGPHQQLYKIVPRSIIRIKQGIPIELHGGGEATLFFVYIRDLADGLLSVLENKLFGVVHFSVPEGKKVREIVEMICQKMGEDFDSLVKIAPRRVGQDTRYCLDFSRTARLTGWQPSTPLDLGIEKTIEWIERNWEVVSSLPHHYQHRFTYR